MPMMAYELCHFKRPQGQTQQGRRVEKYFFAKTYAQSLLSAQWGQNALMERGGAKAYLIDFYVELDLAFQNPPPSPLGYAQGVCSAGSKFCLTFTT